MDTRVHVNHRHTVCTDIEEGRCVSLIHIDSIQEEQESKSPTTCPWRPGCCLHPPGPKWFQPTNWPTLPLLEPHCQSWLSSPRHKNVHFSSPEQDISGFHTWRIVVLGCRSCSWCEGQSREESCRGREEPADGFSLVLFCTAENKKSQDALMFNWSCICISMVTYK